MSKKDYGKLIYLHDIKLDADGNPRQLTAAEKERAYARLVNACFDRLMHPKPDAPKVLEFRLPEPDDDAS